MPTRNPMKPVNTANVIQSSSVASASLLPVLLASSSLLGYVGTGLGNGDGCALRVGDGCGVGTELGSASGAGVGARVSMVMLVIHASESMVLFRAIAVTVIEFDSAPEVTAVAISEPMLP